MIIAEVKFASSCITSYLIVAFLKGLFNYLFIVFLPVFFDFFLVVLHLLLLHARLFWTFSFLVMLLSFIDEIRYIFPEMSDSIGSLFKYALPLFSFCVCVDSPDLHLVKRFSNWQLNSYICYECMTICFFLYCSCAVILRVLHVCGKCITTLLGAILDLYTQIILFLSFSSWSSKLNLNIADSVYLFHL